MKFIVECDGFDGLVLMDQSYLGEMDCYYFNMI
jgi:hypothetical protein